jgi:hypothetical protein
MQLWLATLGFVTMGPVIANAGVGNAINASLSDEDWIGILVGCMFATAAFVACVAVLCMGYFNTILTTIALMARTHDH